MSFPGVGKRPVHACLRCRNRKIRCGREKPECRQCQLHGHRCTYEVDPQNDEEIPYSTRAALFGQEQKVQGLQSRIDDLEATVRDLAVKLDAASATPSSSTNTLSEPIVIKPGYLREEEGEYRYVGSLAWERLLLKSEPNAFFTGANVNNHVEPFSSILFRALKPNFDLDAYLPPADMVRELWNIFKDRVDPMVRILHKPSYEARLLRYLHRRQSASSANDILPGDPSCQGKSTPAFESLILAILYIATKSLPVHEVQALQQNFVNTKSSTTTSINPRVFSKDELLSNFMFAAQQRLLLSDIYSKPRLDSICALTIMMFSKYNEADRDTSLYVCVGVLVRCARMYGLHIDPDFLEATMPNTNRSVPFTQIDIESRRRLWHQIMHLDAMVAEPTNIEPEPLYHGELWPNDPLAKLPMDISDENLKPSNDMDLVEPPADISDMVLQLTRIHASLCLRYIASIGRFGLTYEAARRKAEDAIIAATKKTNDLRRGYPGGEFPGLTAKFFSTLIEHKMWLAFWNRFDKLQDQNQQSWTPRRRRILSGVTEMLESYCRLRDDPLAQKYLWHVQRHSQLHAVMHILDELCRTDPFNVDAETFEVCRRAWCVIKNNKVNDEDSALKRVWSFVQRLTEQAGLRWSTELADAAVASVSSPGQNRQFFDPVDFAAIANTDGLDYFALVQNLDFSFNKDLF